MRIAYSFALAAALMLPPLGLAAQDNSRPAATPGVLAQQNGIVITAGHARSQGAMARSGAAYMTITNQGNADDRLIDVLSDAAEHVELHQTTTDNGVARMRPVTGGIPVPAGQTVTLDPGGAHVMFMGLSRPFPAGGTITVTLIFDRAGPIEVALPVDAGGPAAPETAPMTKMPAMGG